MHLRCHALVSHDLHSTVKGAFILVCFQTLQREWQTGLWRTNVRRMQLDKILLSGGARSSLNLLLVTSSTPAFWSWWRREECFQTRWRRRRSLRRCRSARGWSLCRGYHLVEAGASLQEISWQTGGGGGGNLSGRCSSRSDSTLTFVPVLQGGHHIEADGLVGALLQDGGGETLVRPSQSWGQGCEFSRTTFTRH